MAAAYFALVVARRLGYDLIILEGDALNIINTIRKKESGLAPIYLLYDCLNDLSAGFLGFSCSFLKISGNTVAHMIAKWDTGVAHEKIFMEPFPLGLRALVVSI